MEELRKRGVIVECHHPRLDTSDPAGRLVMAVLADLAEWGARCAHRAHGEGLAQARKQGKTVGRPPMLDAQQRANAVTMREAGITRAEVAKIFGVSLATIRRVERSWARSTPGDSTGITRQVGLHFTRPNGRVPQESVGSLCRERSGC
ncbi:recombinase family protein (plasmid) [Dermacoccus abyssi]|uniref:Recombinase family protein n=1 Tax=Dermacoccus abyssi TaxID=322596 RepID=A0ABX5ZE26_9MICO|nr:recombinase family protein [Dermacoccus abyssi]